MCKGLEMKDKHFQRNAVSSWTTVYEMQNGITRGKSVKGIWDRMEAFKRPGFLLWAVNGSKQERKMDAIYTLEKICFCIMLGERNKGEIEVKRSRWQTIIKVYL